MRTLILFIIVSPFSCFCQEEIKGNWNMECGASTISSFAESTIFNLRYVSPRFRISNNEWTAEEEKQPERFKNGRLMMELLYEPKFKFLAFGLNVQYRLLKLNRFTLEAYGGLKLFFAAPSDYKINPYFSGDRKDTWYINPGFICQVDLGTIDPYLDIGGDGILTLGTEIDIHAMRKNWKKYRTPYLKGS